MIFTPINTFDINIPQNQNTENNQSINVIIEAPLPRMGRITYHNKMNGIFGIHNKYKIDNITVKVKIVLINSLEIFINNNLQKNIGPNFRLKKLEHCFIKNMNTSFNKNLLVTKIKDIFSNDISNIYTIVERDHNKKLINYIYKLYLKEENSKNKKMYDIFEKTLLQCLEQIRGTNNYLELNGLKEIFDELVNKKLNEGEIEYNKNFWYVVNEIENIFANKIERKKIRRNYKW